MANKISTARGKNASKKEKNRSRTTSARSASKAVVSKTVKAKKPEKEKAVKKSATKSATKSANGNVKKTVKGSSKKSVLKVVSAVRTGKKRDSVSLKAKKVTAARKSSPADSPAAKSRQGMKTTEKLSPGIKATKKVSGKKSAVSKTNIAAVSGKVEKGGKKAKNTARLKATKSVVKVGATRKPGKHSVRSTGKTKSVSKLLAAKTGIKAKAGKVAERNAESRKVANKTGKNAKMLAESVSITTGKDELKDEVTLDSVEVASEQESLPSGKYETGKIVYPTPTITELKNFRKASEMRRKLREVSQHDVKATKRRFLAKEPAKGTRYSIDLRIHSPGTIGYFSAGGVDPGPAMLRLSKAKGLDMIGVTDYYNASAVDMLNRCKGTLPLTIIPGFDMRCEVSGCRDVFFTVLFPEETTSEMIFTVLQELRVPESVYGNREYCLPRPLGEVLEVIESHQGVAIPSRIDKTPYRQLAIPALVENFGFHTFDLIHPENTEFFRERWPEGEFTFLSFSNAHALAQIGSRRSNMRLEKPGFEGLKERVSRRS